MICFSVKVNPISKSCLQARISQLMPAPVPFVRFVFGYTCRHVFSRRAQLCQGGGGKNSPARPLTGPPDLSSASTQVLVPPSYRILAAKRQERSWHAHIHRTSGGGGRWVIWQRARLNTTSGGGGGSVNSRPLDCFRNFLISTNYLCRKMLRLERICVSKWEIKDCGAVHFNLNTEG